MASLLRMAAPRALARPLLPLRTTFKPAQQPMIRRFLATQTEQPRLRLGAEGMDLRVFRLLSTALALVILSDSD